MKIRTALIAAAFCIAVPAGGQTPVPSTEQKPAQHQPGTPAPHKPGEPAPDQAEKPEPGATATPKPDPAKEAAIHHLMDLTQSAKLGDNIQSYITNQVRTGLARALKPDALPKFMDEFNSKSSCVSRSRIQRNGCDGTNLCQRFLNGRYSGLDPILRVSAWTARGEKPPCRRPAVPGSWRPNRTERRPDDLERNVRGVPRTQANPPTRTRTAIARLRVTCGAAASARSLGFLPIATRRFRGLQNTWAD